MHQASVPIFLRALGNLRHVLQKGEAFAVEKSFEPDLLLQQRLIVDMLPLVRQVQIATDMAKNGSFRLAGSTRRSSRTTRPRSRSCTRASIAPWR